MELTYQCEIRLPASCCAISEEEMTYIDGGRYSFDFFDYTITIQEENLPRILMEFAENVAYVMGMGITGAALDGLIKGYKDGLTVGQTISHYWGRQNTFGRWATVLVAVPLGTYYAINASLTFIATAISIYNSCVELYNSCVDMVNYVIDIVPKVTADLGV